MSERLWPVAAAVLVALAAASARGDGPPVVLLTNHSVLRGTARLERDQWIVELSRGGRVVLPRQDVLARFPSMAEAFAWRQAQLDPGDADAWLSLGFWALRHDYRDGAAMILQSRAANGGLDTRFAALQEQIRRYPPSTSRQPTTSPGQPAGLSWKEISETQRRFFFERVEPILLQRCGMVGCHGPGGDFAFRLLPPHPSEQRRSSTSLHNLRTTLRQIQPRATSASRLADFAAQAHADRLTGPPLSPDGPEWNILDTWLRRLTSPKADAPEKMLPDAVGPTVLTQQPTPNLPRDVQGSPHSLQSRDPYDPQFFNEARRHP